MAEHVIIQNKLIEIRFWKTDLLLKRERKQWRCPIAEKQPTIGYIVQTPLFRFHFGIILNTDQKITKVNYKHASKLLKIKMIAQNPGRRGKRGMLNPKFKMWPGSMQFIIKLSKHFQLNGIFLQCSYFDLKLQNVFLGFIK